MNGLSSLKIKKREREGDTQDNALWLISFGDLLTLVLSTFLLLISLKAYSIGANEKPKEEVKNTNVTGRESLTFKLVSEKIWEPNNRELLEEVVKTLKSQLASETVTVEIRPCFSQDQEWLPLHLYRLSRGLGDLSIKSQINPLFIHCEEGMAVGFKGKI